VSAPAEGRVTLRRDGAVAHVVFDRPAARNAFTWQMYDELDAIVGELSADESLRAVVMRGAGGKAFVAGSDITQFREFGGGEDGIAYEAKMDGYFTRLLGIPVPVVGVIEGWAVGGGLNIAACCDIRIATHGTRFGSPIARTIGNCVSMRTYQRIVGGFGEARAKRMLLLAEFIDAEEAMQAGFLARLVAADVLEETVATVVTTILENAPLTLRVSKEAIARLRPTDIDPADDLMALCYGSADFKTGVEAFIAKSKPQWQGR
jgi:enoyl-CoA hydratase/carnithine racemase